MDARGESGPDLFRRLVDHSLGLMCVHDLDGNLLFINEAAAQALGYRPDDGAGWNLRRFLSPSVEPQFDAYLERVRTNGVDRGFMRVRARDGTERIWSYRNVLHAEPGAPPRVLGHAQDVTDRVRAERALRESERRFRRLADTAPVLIWMADARGLSTFLNHPWLDFVGRPLEDQLGSGWIESIHPADRGRFTEAFLAAVATRGPFRIEYRLRRVDGEYRWMLGSGAPRLEDDSPFAAGFIGSCVDITETRRAHEVMEAARDELSAVVAQRTAELLQSYEELRAETQRRAAIEEEVGRARRLESLAMLAGGLAHEFNNLLTVIVGRSELMMARLPASEPMREDLDRIYDAARRVAALTGELLAFGRKQLLEPRPVDLNELVSGLALPAIVGDRVELGLRLAERLRPASVDPGQLERVVLHLVERARDAMPDGGRLVIETANVDLDAAFVQAHPGARAGPHIRLTVRDTGRGMDEVTRSRVFEPFFTARHGVQGSGLALAAVHGITSQHGGYIAVESEPDRGTAFLIYLAAGEVAAPAGAAHEPSAAAREGIGTILVVEDEDEVRELLRDILDGHGYRVIDTRDPDEALACVRDRPDPIDLVLTDVVVPRMTGPALAERIAEIRPRIKVLFMSGYAADALGQQGMLDPGAAFLGKPFSMTSLLARVRDLLAAD